MGPLDHWLLANADKLDLQIRFFDNHILESLGIFDIEARIHVGEKNYWGRGTSFDKEIALKKACSEAIERFFLHKNKFLNSNGIAVHTSETLAIEAAKFELIERDLFLCRFLTKTPFFKIQLSSNSHKNWSRSLAGQSIGLNFYSMGLINSIRGVLCVIDGLEYPEPFGYILGTAAGNLNTAIESSFIEAFRNFAHYKKSQSMTLTEFTEKMSKREIDFKEHGNLALDPQYAQTLKNDLFTCADPLEVNESINLGLNFDKLSAEETPFQDAPMAVVRATSTKLQNLFVGNVTEANLNLNRLKSFCISYNRPYQLYNLPHPFN
jgi:hypothetical protein